MTVDDWSTIITKITPHSPEHLDDILESFDARRTTNGRCIFPENNWHNGQSPFRDTATVCIGVRIDGDNVERSDLSMKLASMALEKNVIPVILFEGDYSGMERFGFRTEKIAGESKNERRESEEQLKQFWNISVVI